MKSQVMVKFIKANQVSAMDGFTDLIMAPVNVCASSC